MIRKAWLGAVVFVVWLVGIAGGVASSSSQSQGPGVSTGPSVATDDRLSSQGLSVSTPPGVLPVDESNGVLRRGSTLGTSWVTATFGLGVVFATLAIILRRRRAWLQERPRMIPEPSKSSRRPAQETVTQLSPGVARRTSA